MEQDRFIDFERAKFSMTKPKNSSNVSPGKFCPLEIYKSILFHPDHPVPSCLKFERQPIGRRDDAGQLRVNVVFLQRVAGRERIEVHRRDLPCARSARGGDQIARSAVPGLVRQIAKLVGKIALVNQNINAFDKRIIIGCGARIGDKAHGVAAPIEAVAQAAAGMRQQRRIDAHARDFKRLGGFDFVPLPVKRQRKNHRIEQIGANGIARFGVAVKSDFQVALALLALHINHVVKKIQADRVIEMRVRQKNVQIRGQFALAQPKRAASTIEQKRGIGRGIGHQNACRMTGFAGVITSRAEKFNAHLFLR